MAVMQYRTYIWMGTILEMLVTYFVKIGPVIQEIKTNMWKVYGQTNVEQWMTYDDRQYMAMSPYVDYKYWTMDDRQYVAMSPYRLQMPSKIFKWFLRV